MLDPKVIFTAIGILISAASYIIYIRGIFWKGTKPHAFSWFVWALLALIISAIQFTEGVGLGAAVAGFSGSFCLLIAFIALKRGSRSFPLFDWISLAISLIALGLWLFADQALLAVILIIISDVFGFLPTIRKGFEKPYEETLLTFFMSAVKWIFSILAFEQMTLVGVLYPACLIVVNFIFVSLVLARRAGWKASMKGIQ